MKRIVIGITSAIIIILGCVYYYVTLPALNIHSAGFWWFLITLLIFIALILALKQVIEPGQTDIPKTPLGELSKGKLKILTTAIFVIIAIFIIGSIASSPIINADRYTKLIKVQKRNFKEDIKQADFRKIPLLDKASATLLGNRKMGSMVDLVSQFEVSNLYSQINYQGKPMRVTPLVYASPIKWLTNSSEGIPAYIKIDMATQKTELVKLKEGIKYSTSEYLNRYVYRHLRFNYPTYIFDELSFEVDDEGVPYWICPVKDFTIGLFGGETIGRVVLLNAITGETKDYAIEDCPQWVDKAYPARLLLQQYNYYGKLINGYINSILSQKGCLQSTYGYNYLAMNDDVWVYTGITSVSGDKSNVGFVLMNQRTQETRFYLINGAEEYSAMQSAEGQVQNLSYQSTFPLLINVADEPTYFMALKDGAGLVKKYAMINIQSYQNVAIGDTVAECIKKYTSLLKNVGITIKDISGKAKIVGEIGKLEHCVIEGNTYYYITFPNSDKIYEIPFVKNKKLINFNVGDSVQLEYVPGEEVQEILAIKKQNMINNDVIKETRNSKEETISN